MGVWFSLGLAFLHSMVEKYKVIALVIGIVIIIIISSSSSTLHR